MNSPGNDVAAPLTVLVIDDHKIVAQGVEFSLQESGVKAEVVYSRGIQDVPRVLPEGTVAILDLRLRDGSTPAHCLDLLEKQNLPTVVYTSADDPILVREAISAGTLAVVRKSEPPETLVEALLLAAQGIPSAGLDWAAALDTDRDFVVDSLTPTEASVLALYASGESAKRIARRLDLSIHTVNKAVATIRDKYREDGREVESRVDLFRRAAEDGVVSFFDPPTV